MMNLWNPFNSTKAMLQERVPTRAWGRNTALDAPDVSPPSLILANVPYMANTIVTQMVSWWLGGKAKVEKIAYVGTQVEGELTCSRVHVHLHPASLISYHATQVPADLFNLGVLTSIVSFSLGTVNCGVMDPSTVVRIGKLAGDALKEIPKCARGTASSLASVGPPATPGAPSPAPTAAPSSAAAASAAHPSSVPSPPLSFAAGNKVKGPPPMAVVEDIHGAKEERRKALDEVSRHSTCEATTSSPPRARGS